MADVVPTVNSETWLFPTPLEDRLALTISDLTAEYKSLLFPPTLGSQEDLNSVTAPLRRRTVSGSISGNPNFHYPPGAAHGFLDVIELGTDYTAHIWVEVIAGWIAIRRKYSGTWREWVRVGEAEAATILAPIEARVAALESGAASSVQDERTVSVTSDYRPDIFVEADGTVAYWTAPSGVERVPWTYKGDGYVGRIGTAPGYTTMQVKKVESSGEVEVSCFNTTTGRHVTHRVQAGGADDQRRFEEGWIGAYSGTTVSKDLLILPRSNIEWAFQIDVDGNAQFAPYHGSSSAQATEYEPVVITDANGDPIDLDALAVDGVLTGVNGFKLRQRLYITHPDSGATRWAAVDEVRTIAPDGMIQSESVITFLEETTIGNMYAPMTPVDYSTFDALHILDGSTYSVKTTPPATTEYVTVTEGHAATSALFTSTASPDAFVAVAFLDPDATLMRGHALEETGSTALRFEQRSSGLTKLYPVALANGSVIPAGTVWHTGAQWRYGETPDAAQYV